MFPVERRKSWSGHNPELTHPTASSSTSLWFFSLSGTSSEGGEERLNLSKIQLEVYQKFSLVSCWHMGRFRQKTMNIWNVANDSSKSMCTVCIKGWDVNSDTFVGVFLQDSGLLISTCMARGGILARPTLCFSHIPKWHNMTVPGFWFGGLLWPLKSQWLHIRTEVAQMCFQCDIKWKLTQKPFHNQQHFQVCALLSLAFLTTLSKSVSLAAPPSRVSEASV